MTAPHRWRYKTLQDLEQCDLGNPEDAVSDMVKRCVELTKIPLNQFTAEDLRLMIGQGFAFRYLIPLATEQLKVDIFIETRYFPGDLLHNVLSIDPEFWLKNKEMWAAVNDLIKNRRTEINVSKISTKRFDVW